jgi:hypothetical protein
MTASLSDRIEALRCLLRSGRGLSRSGGAGLGFQKGNLRSRLRPEGPHWGLTSRTPILDTVVLPWAQDSGHFPIPRRLLARHSKRSPLTILSLKSTELDIVRDDLADRAAVTA